MKVIVCTAVIFAIIVISSVDAQRPTATSTWQRDVDGVTVRQSGQVFDHPAIRSASIMVETYGPESRNASLAPSTTRYDFIDAENPVSAVKVLGRCFLIPVPDDLDFTTASQDITQRDGTVVTDTLTTLELDGTSRPMNVRDRQTSLPASIKKFCRGSPVIQTSTPEAALPAPGAEEEGQKVTTVLTLTSKVNILRNAPSPPRRSED